MTQQEPPRPGTGTLAQSRSLRQAIFSYPPPPEASSRPALSCSGGRGEPSASAEAVGAMPVPPGGSDKLRASAVAAEGRRPLPTEDGDQPTPGLAASRGEGTRPTQSSKRLIRAAYPTERKRRRQGNSRGVCACLGRGALFGGREPRGVSTDNARSMGEGFERETGGFLCTPPGSVRGGKTAPATKCL